MARSRNDKKLSTMPSALAHMDKVLAMMEDRIEHSLTWTEIAIKYEYANPNGARHAVVSYMQRRESDVLEDMRTDINMRYEKLLQTYWPGAIGNTDKGKPDLRYATFCRDVLRDMARLNGLFEHQGDVGEKNQQVIQIYLPQKDDLPRESVEIIEGTARDTAESE